MRNSNMYGQLATFLRNPSQFVQKQMGISGQLANNPDAIIEQMMASGRISQMQYNQARQMARQIQNNPAFSNLINRL